MDIEAFERYCNDSRIFQYPNDEAWRALRNVFPVRTMDTLHGIIIMTRSERQLPRVPLEDLYITDVIKTLRGVVTGPYVPDNMEEAQIMRYQVMSVLNACSGD